MNKSEYVRGLPRDWTPREVVRRAKAEGIRISEATVYAARRQQQSVGPTTIRTVARPQASGIARSEKERELLELSLELGVTQATELLDNLRTRLRAVAF